MTTIRLVSFVLAIGTLALPALAEDPPPAPATPPGATSDTATPAAPAAPVAPLATAAPAAPAANAGRVYVSYPAQPQANYDANLAIDELWVANPIKSGSCVYFDLPVGSHRLHSTTTPSWYVTVAAGDSKYTDLRYRGGAGGLAPLEGSAPADLSACTQGSSPL